MKKTMNNIYVVLVKAHTGLGRLARKITRYEYTHIAVCLDASLEEFVTFSRKKHYAPFDAGFMRETRDCYAYGKQKGVKFKVFRVPVEDKQMQRIKRYIARLEQDREFVFNMYSMLTMPILHGFRIRKAHNCMSFVGKILELSGTVVLEKPYYRYDIKQMDELLTPFYMCEKVYQRGKLRTAGYMDKVSVVQNIRDFARINWELMKRLLLN